MISCGQSVSIYVEEIHWQCYFMMMMCYNWWKGTFTIFSQTGGLFLINIWNWGSVYYFPPIYVAHCHFTIVDEFVSGVTFECRCTWENRNYWYALDVFTPSISFIVKHYLVDFIFWITVWSLMELLDLSLAFKKVYQSNIVYCCIAETCITVCSWELPWLDSPSLYPF